MPTRRFRQLDRRLAELEKHLLPPVREDLRYTAKDRDYLRSYLVLCHAEIEACIEDLARNVMRKARDRWRKDGRARPPLVALVAFHEGGFGAPAKALVYRGSRKAPPTLDERIGTAFEAYDDFVRKENHGVREPNLLRVLLPIGVRESDLDPPWVAQMNTFGGRRGSVAHSSAGAIKSAPDPAGAREEILAIVAGLEQLDSLLAKLGR